jgi:hypothetical protein
LRTGTNRAARAAGRAALALILLAVCGCLGGEDAPGKDKDGMDKWHVSEECDFSAFAAGLLEETACSPVIDDPEFVGIVLNAPERVVYEPGEPPVPGSDAFADVRVCGTACVEHGFLGLEGMVQREILLVAVDSATQETYSGRLPGIENAVAPPDDLPPGGGPTEGLLVESYFNPNLAELLDLPERPAEYIVHAVLGEMKSNIVRIRVEKQE